MGILSIAGIMRIDTTKHLAYSMITIHKLAATLDFLYEWMPTQDPKRQMLVGLMIKELEAEYERVNEHYLAFANQAMLTRKLNPSK